jgi:hypothetical protein
MPGTSVPTTRSTKPCATKRRAIPPSSSHRDLLGGQRHHHTEVHGTCARSGKEVSVHPGALQAAESAPAGLSAAGPRKGRRAGGWSAFPGSDGGKGRHFLMHLLTTATGALYAAFFEVGHAEQKGEFFLTLVAAKNVIRHPVLPSCPYCTRGRIRFPSQPVGGLRQAFFFSGGPTARVACPFSILLGDERRIARS